MAHRILVPQPGMETMPPVVEVLRLNPWVTREFFSLTFFNVAILMPVLKHVTATLVVSPSPLNCRGGAIGTWCFLRTVVIAPPHLLWGSTCLAGRMTRCALLRFSQAGAGRAEASAVWQHTAV